MFYFFKQKTAYEMRISDWSSDVCSSDLGGLGVHRLGLRRGALVFRPAHPQALGPFLGAEIARPVPNGDGDVNLGVLGRDTDHLRAAPGDRPHRGVGPAVLGAGVLAGLVALGYLERNLLDQDIHGTQHTITSA